MEYKEKILIENAKEYLRFAVEARNQNKYNTAITLFFKTLATLCDLYLLRKEGKIPSSHSDRFRILEQKYKEIYNMLDNDFPFYQDSYTIKMDKESVEVLEEDVKKLAKIVKIEL